MLDINHIAGQSDNVKIFYARGTSDWQTWQKPRNCKFIWIMCIGGAGGGAAGTSGTGGATTYTGGQGGNSAAVTRALFPANVLPDTLYIQPGPGGSATPAGQQASPGNRSFVSTAASTLNTGLICISGNAAATSVSTTNTAETAAVVGSASLLNLSTFVSIAGIQAINLGDTTPLTTTIVTGGGFGSNAGPTTGATFSILATPFSPLISPTSVISGTPSSGTSFVSLKPFFSTGGVGGGSFYQNSGNGGKGGDGGFGSGGGGGGAAYNGTGGTGGKGGDGLVIIATF